MNPTPRHIILPLSFLLMNTRLFLTILPIASLNLLPLQADAQNILADVQSGEPSLAYLWEFQGQEGAKVATSDDSSGTMPLERGQAEKDDSVFATIAGKAPGGGNALCFPAPASPENGGWLRTKMFDWPEEGTVEFLIKPSSDGPLESGQAVSGISLSNRWYVFQPESGHPLLWWVGGANPGKENRPDILGGTSPAHLQDDTWYYVVLQYRFDAASSSCDLKAYVAALNTDNPKLEVVVDTKVAAAGPSDTPPLQSRLNLGGEANGSGSRWYGCLANLAIYSGWLTEDRINVRLKTLSK